MIQVKHSPYTVPYVLSKDERDGSYSFFDFTNHMEYHYMSIDEVYALLSNFPLDNKEQFINHAIDTGLAIEMNFVA